MPTLIFYLRDYMQSVRSIVSSFLFVAFIMLGATIIGNAQENSPYSRYGLGDNLPTQNVLNRAMGGISVAYYDLQSVNFSNPASYSRLKLTTYDVGLEYASRVIRSTNTTKAFNSAYLIPTYLIMGFPLSKKKNWGMVLGLRPETKINYDIFNRSRIPGIDSVINQYVGTGGSYQAMTGVGYGTKNFSIGLNAGYVFGNKHFTTKQVLLNDTVVYNRARYTDSTDFGGFFLKGGAMYQFKLGEKYNLRFGLTYGLETKMNARRVISRETYQSSVRGDVIIDSIYKGQEERGQIIMPAGLGVAFLLERKDMWMFSAELNQTQWSRYRYFGKSDAIRDNWTLRMGGQLIPDINGKSYWGRVAYRAGFYYGPDFLNMGMPINSWAITLGTGLPVRRSFYTNQYTTVNTAFEIGSRGTRQNALRESLFRISFGFNLSDIWFNKRTYQ